MANQSPDRREVLNMLGRVAALSSFPGFSKWMFAGEHKHEAAAPPPARPENYKPQFFTPAEYTTADILCELIIPADETPGAHAAGVSEFMDFMAAHDDELQYPLRSGLAWLNALAVERYQQPFAALGKKEQEGLLETLAYRERQVPSQQEGQAFFNLFRKYTVIGYYTSRIGLEQLDYPGLRLYPASPECPHKNDPEHRHLRRTQ